jgi:PRTRC genetic system protein A
MDARDIALQSVMPTVMVPAYSDFNELDIPGNRVLMAGNGAWLEVCRAWMYMRTQIAPLPIAVPYGQMTPKLHFPFINPPRALISQFIENAKERLPNECAAWVTWNETTGVWKLITLEDISSGEMHVESNLPVLAEGEHMVLDLHSHGKLPAFFSDEDDHDDRGECKIVGVVGNLDTDKVTAKFRICANGLFIPYSFPKEEIK